LRSSQPIRHREIHQITGVKLLVAMLISTISAPMSCENTVQTVKRSDAEVHVINFVQINTVVLVISTRLKHASLQLGLLIIRLYSKERARRPIATPMMMPAVHSFAKIPTIISYFVRHFLI